MEHFQAKRVTREFTAQISAPSTKVFPLLCPVREYDWLDGWSCDMIYSESGVVERDCIFTTGFLSDGEQIWVTTRYDPENFVKEFLVINPDSRVTKFDVSLIDRGDDTTEGRWRITITALNERGNEFVDRYSEELHRHYMGMLVHSLDHYCRTGSMLKLRARAS